MVYTPGSGGRVEVVVPANVSVSVSIARASGGALTVYSDATRTASVAMPATATGTSTFYLADDDLYTLGATVSGVQCASFGGTVGAATLYIRGDTTLTLNTDRETAETAGANAAFAPITGSAAYVAPDVYAPAATGVAATDTANVLAAIAATPVGGWLHFRRGQYYLNASPTLTQSIRITGVSDHPASLTNIDIPAAAPYLTGTVFNMVTAATDVFKITGKAIRVDMENFGIRFDPSIMFSNTGHGINSTPPALSGHLDIGNVYGVIKNVTVFGHDGNHYALFEQNSLGGIREHIRSFGGGIWYLGANSTSSGGINYGNIYAADVLGEWFCAGTADAFHMDAPNASGTGLLNLCKIIRPQANVESQLALFGCNPPTAAQYLWNDNGTPVDMSIEAPDLENDQVTVTCLIRFGPQTYVQPEGGVMTFNAGGSLPWYRRQKPYNSSIPPTVAANSGLGTGGTVTVQSGSTDLVGRLDFTVGTSPGGAGTQLCTVTFGTSMATLIAKAVILTPAFGSPAVPIYIGALATTAFNIKTTSAQTAAAVFSLYYQVLQ